MKIFHVYNCIHVFSFNCCADLTVVIRLTNISTITYGRRKCVTYKGLSDISITGILLEKVIKNRKESKR